MTALKFIWVVLGALIVGAFIVALGVLVIYLQRSAESGPFDVGTTIVIVLYLAFPLFAIVAFVMVVSALALLLGASVSAAMRWWKHRRVR